MKAAAQHTPGPWMWDSDPVKGDQFGRVRYRVVARGETITNMHYSSYEGGPTNAEANARLIAAAPELLEALQKSIALADSNRDAALALGREVIRPPEMQAVYERCVAAVAKATGAN